VTRQYTVVDLYIETENNYLYTTSLTTTSLINYIYLLVSPYNHHGIAL
jgi:hypothetical protein